MEDQNTIAGAREALNLEQRLVGVRKHVQSIATQKITTPINALDVYSIMTPALNEFGVNFDVIDETATRHYENGDPLYITNYKQQVSDGTITAWVYESDIVIEWVNADDPAEFKTVKLHIVGKSTDGPDAARSCAWASAIRYYLLERFGVGSGSDMPEESRGTRPAQLGPEGRGEQNHHRGKLSGAQVNRLYKKGEAAGCANAAIKQRIHEKYGIDDPSDLTRAQYDEICNALDQAAASRSKESGGNGNA